MGVAIVTGGTRGIGKAIALELAKDGFNVVITYNSNEAKALEVKALCDSYNESMILKANVCNEEECQNVIDETINKFGQIDVLVNNAGITADGLMLRMSSNDFDKVINTNLRGTFLMVKYASRVMMKKRSGKIINMSSVIGEVGNVGQVNYAASKGGVIALTKAAAKELASRGITVNAIAPGYIDTDMTSVLNDEIKDSIIKSIPLARIGKPEDIANMVSFLASDKANYITGQVINVDGGMVM